MADSPSYPDSTPNTDDDTGRGPDRGSAPGMPRWLKVSGIIVIVFILLVVIAVATGIGGPDVVHE